MELNAVGSFSKLQGALAFVLHYCHKDGITLSMISPEISHDSQMDCRNSFIKTHTQFKDNVR